MIYQEDETFQHSSEEDSITNCEAAAPHRLQLNKKFLFFTFGEFMLYICHTVDLVS